MKVARLCPVKDDAAYALRVRVRAGGTATGDPGDAACCSSMRMGNAVLLVLAWLFYSRVTPVTESSLWTFYLSIGRKLLATAEAACDLAYFTVQQL